MDNGTLTLILTKLTDLILTGANVYVMFSLRKMQNNRTLTDALKEDNREMRKHIDYLSHRLRVAKIKARREKVKGL